MVDDFAGSFGFFADRFPFGIVLERLPIGFGGFTAGMLQNVDEHVAFSGFVDGNPVGDALHSVAREEFIGMIAKAREQVGKFSFDCVIDAKFIDG